MLCVGLPRPVVGYLAQSFLPSSKYDICVQRCDFRLHWAVNSGARSMIHIVPIYQPHTLEKQLNAVIRYYHKLALLHCYTYLY